MAGHDTAKALARVYFSLEVVISEKGPGAGAVAMAEARVKVFPMSAGVNVHEGNEDKKAKRPLTGCGFYHGIKDGSTDPAKVALAWKRWPTAMIGVPCDENGVVVVDVDRSKWNETTGEWSPDGLDTVRAWEQEHGPLPDTLRVRTPSGGWHYVFLRPDGDILPNTAGIYPGIDVRSSGSTVAPGSRTADGGVYVLENPGAEILPMPGWLLGKLRNPPRRERPATTATPWRPSGTASSGRGPVAGGVCYLEADGWTKYGHRTVDGAMEDVASAKEPGRNNTLYSKARHVGEVMAKGHVPDSEAPNIRSGMIYAAVSAGLEERESENTFDSGFGEGVKNRYAPDVPEVGEAPAWRDEDVSGMRGLGRLRESASSAPGTAGVAVTASVSAEYRKDGETGQDGGSPFGPAPAPSRGSDGWTPLGADGVLEGFDCRRGLSMEICGEYGLGYSVVVGEDGEASHWMRIPTGPTSCVEVDARPEAEVLAGCERAPKRFLGDPQIFRRSALWTAGRPVFVVMDEIDALSVVDVGGEAVALGVAGNADRLLKELTAVRPGQPLVLALGEGEMAVKARTALVDGLRKLHVEPYVFDPADGHVSVNASLVYDRDGLGRLVGSIVDEQSLKDIIHAREEERLNQLSAAVAVDGFLERVEARSGRECEPTGFKILDAMLDGGLYPGLYVVGAISGLGKTTFALQIADHVARNGRDVLIFSLEMSRDELIAKSLSRLTHRSRYSSDWKTTRKILNARFWGDFGDEEWDCVNGAIADYREHVGPHVFITEGIGDVGVGRICEMVRRFHDVRGTAPIVLVDYLQILAPADPRATDKQNVDKNVLELKRLSRDHNTTVLGISSFNRENYVASVNLTAFKESGAIEYSSDVVIGIQYEGMENVDDESDAARKRRTQSVLADVDAKSGQMKDQTVQVKILKNRNGRRGDVFFTLSNAFNSYEEIPPEHQERHRRHTQTTEGMKDKASIDAFFCDAEKAGQTRKS